MFSSVTRIPIPVERDPIEYVGRDFVYSNEKLKKTGYKFIYADARDGLRDTVRWYQQEAGFSGASASRVGSTGSARRVPSRRAWEPWERPRRESMKNEPRQPNGDRFDYISLCLSTNDMLEDVMRKGVQPDLEKLAGWEFRGCNTPEYAVSSASRSSRRASTATARPARGGSRGTTSRSSRTPWAIRGSTR